MVFNSVRLVVNGMMMEMIVVIVYSVVIIDVCVNLFGCSGLF